MFEIGSKVVCVDASMQAHTVEELKVDVPFWIKKGQHYTIRGFLDVDFTVGVYLEEVVNPIKYFRVVNRTFEPSFRMDRFRALTESELEISVEKEEEILV